MPTYSYKCNSCGDAFDIKQSFSDEVLQVCEKCGGELRKLFNSVGVIFKGSGFYRNDSGKGDLKASNNSIASKGNTAPALPNAASKSCCGGGCC